MPPPALRTVLFAAATALAGVAFVATIRRGEPPPRATALAAIPADAMLVATADLERLRASSVLAPLVREGGGAARRRHALGGVRVRSGRAVA